ncbi:MAG TPA: universal stress protein [Thermomicrobiales bacterium]|nr:universal stress protein [Thermomicrobiales bacterium]
MTDQDNARRSVRSAKLERVLVPVDGSPASERALEYAAHLRPERIVLLRVEVDEPVGPHVDPADPYERWRRDHLSTVMNELESLARSKAATADVVEPKIRFGNPADRIMAEAHDHDLIVMGATGKGAAGRLLFGSVADRVMRNAITPTLVVRTNGDEAEIRPPARVVVPLDGSELAERALPMATRVSAALSIPIRLVRCVGMDEVLHTVREARRSGDAELFESSDDPYKLGQERANREAEAYLEAVPERLGVAGQNVTCERLSGSAAFELLWSLQEDELVVMTSRGRGGLQRWVVGSVAEKLVREAKAPVLLVPVGRAGMESE